ncbi:MAG TPA: hypothetical protein VKH83_06520 [Methylomirabilota bacterium]|nr:hypothetical protein [Methylomirabilota bacterium]
MTMTRARRLGALLVTTTICAGWLAPPVLAQDTEKIAMSRVRFTTEPGLTQGCSRLGSVRDDSLKDLRRKVVKFGGNTALLTFGGLEDLGVVFAEVFRCVEQPAAAPGTAPARVPVPPAGPPPPPPPPPTR